MPETDPAEVLGHLRTALEAERSRVVVRRFLFKCLVFGAWAAIQSLFGLSPLRQLASVAFMAAILAQGVAIWRRERVGATHWTSFDEASWFLLIGLGIAELGP